MGGNFFLFFTVETWKPIKHSNQNAWVMLVVLLLKNQGVKTTTTPVLLQVKGYFNVQSFLQ
jgi:hypothetical protein